MTQKRFRQLDPTDPLRIWKRYFWPEYEATETRRGVTSHFGRHWFTTYWQVHQDLNSGLVVYMRGDLPGSSVENARAISAYIHTFYEDIESIYRDWVFKLSV